MPVPVPVLVSGPGLVPVPGLVPAAGLGCAPRQAAGCGLRPGEWRSLWSHPPRESHT